LCANAQIRRMNPKGPIPSTSKGMNQILKARGARKGEVSTGRQRENETPAKDATRGEAKETTGAGVASKLREAAAVENWSISLQSGLACLPLWQQSILPVMDFIEQTCEAVSMDLWQTPQGVNATRTPSINVIRMRIDNVLRILGGYILSGNFVKRRLRDLYPQSVLTLGSTKDG
jgi:hypothetical protein